LAGLRNVHPLNLYGLPYYGIFRLPSAAIEPSHAARILTVYGYAYLKLNQYKYGRFLSLLELYKNDKLFILSFIYTMFAIGSGTAMVGFVILMLHFFRPQYAITMVVFLFLCYFIAPLVNYEPFVRAINTITAVVTLDTSEVYAADASASGRVNIILSTVQNMDLSDPQTWLGKSRVAGASVQLVEGIEYYGLISYLLKLYLIARCCFTKILSLEVLIFITLMSLDVRNFAYAYAIIMVLCVHKYFYLQYSRKY
jgi:hypothetical protein